MVFALVLLLLAWFTIGENRKIVEPIQSHCHLPHICIYVINCGSRILFFVDFIDGSLQMETAAL